MRISLMMAKRGLVAVERSVIEVMFGGWDSLLFALVTFMILEYLTQILISILNKKLSREIGAFGMVKRASIFFLVTIGNVIDVLIIQNGSIFRSVVILFYISYEGITILKNVEILGLPIPQKLKDILEKLEDE